MIAASIFHQQGFEEVVGYRKTVGDDITCVSKFLSPRIIVIVETANTAYIPTLSTDEKCVNKHYHNIDRRVLPSIYISVLQPINGAIFFSKRHYHARNLMICRAYSSEY